MRKAITWLFSEQSKTDSNKRIRSGHNNIADASLGPEITSLIWQSYFDKTRSDSGDDSLGEEYPGDFLLVLVLDTLGDHSGISSKSSREDVSAASTTQCSSPVITATRDTLIVSTRIRETANVVFVTFGFRWHASLTFEFRGKYSDFDSNRTRPSHCRMRWSWVFKSKRELNEVFKSNS